MAQIIEMVFLGLDLFGALKFHWFRVKDEMFSWAYHFSKKQLFKCQCRSGRLLQVWPIFQTPKSRLFATQQTTIDAPFAIRRLLLPPFTTVYASSKVSSAPRGEAGRATSYVKSERGPRTRGKWEKAASRRSMEIRRVPDLRLHWRGRVRLGAVCKRRLWSASLHTTRGSKMINNGRRSLRERSSRAPSLGK